MQKTPYTGDFFGTRDAGTRGVAGRVLDLLPLEQIPVRSAVDIGCGVGTWLSILKERGATDIVGVDGPWVQPEHLVIPSDRFRACDLTEGIDLGRKFDLAISIEVAEHLEEIHADRFVEDLCRHSDFVLFSAAIPHQGGVHHVNEQWPSYWIKKFAANGYCCFDIVRPTFWTDTACPPWFKQAAFAFAAQGSEALDILKVWNSDRAATDMPTDIVHPTTYCRQIEHPDSLRRAAGILWRAASSSLKYRTARRLGR